jgi:hypothetical protein
MNLIQKLKWQVADFIEYRSRKFAADYLNSHWLSLRGNLAIVHYTWDGGVVDKGIVSRAKVTTEFVNFMVDQLQTETSAWGDFKYHLSGTGTTAENKTDTQVETPIGTSRESGTQTEDDADDYQSVATIAYSDTYAVTEHGIFNEQYASAQTDGILMDRSVFSSVNVVNGDSIAYTYTLNCASET